MGGSASKQKQVVDYFNKISTKAALSVTNKNIQSSSVGMSQSQEMKIGDVKGKSFTLAGVNFKQTSKLDFKSMQNSMIDNQFSMDMMDKMKSLFKQDQESGATLLDFGDQDTEAKVTNIIENELNTSFSNEQISECLSAIKQKQSLEIGNINVVGDVLIGPVNFEQTAEAVVNCMLTTNAKNTIVQKIIKETSNDGSQSTKKTGVVQDAGTAVSDAAKGIGEGVGTGAKGIGEGVSTGAKGIGEGVGTAAEGVGKGIGGIFEGSMKWIIIGAVVLAIFGLIFLMIKKSSKKAENLAELNNNEIELKYLSDTSSVVDLGTDFL